MENDPASLSTFLLDLETQVENIVKATAVSWDAFERCSSCTTSIINAHRTTVAAGRLCVAEIKVRTFTGMRVSAQVD